MIGVKTEEILLSHILIQSCIIIIHSIIVILSFFPIWGLECKGSVLNAFVLVFLNGFCGLMYGEYLTRCIKRKRVTAIQKLLIIFINAFSGFIISIMCTNHSTAHYMSAGSFFPLILLNGESLCFLFRENYFLISSSSRNNILHF